MNEIYGNAGPATATSAGSRRTMTAFFDDQTAAERAVEALRAAGITDASVTLTGGEDYRGRDAGERGLWDTISDFFFPEEDRAAYSEGLRRGGYLVTVRDVPDALQERAIDILDDEGAVDLEKRSESWRAEGWVAAGAASMAGTGLDTGAEPAGTRMGETVPSPSDARTGDAEVIPVAEERMKIGKRDVSLGRVRVRSYVVEEPVSEEVRLRSERVEVDRQPVDRQISEGDAAFTDRTLEAEEHAEEAVISKDARVTEEIGLRRSSDERVETVEDSVRHTEVEVEDERGNVENIDPRRRGA